MAYVGQTLSTPESGWTRIDNTHSLIKYTGEKFMHNASHASSYNQTVTYIPADAATSSEILQHKITFSFKGTSIRAIGTMDTSYTKKYCISVDGVDTISDVSGQCSAKTLLGQVTDLENKVHKVEIKCLDGIRYSLDCIDIVGEMCEEPSLLNIALNKKVTCTGNPYDIYVQSNITDGDTSTGYIALLSTSFEAEVTFDDNYACSKAIIHGIRLSGTQRTKDFDVILKRDGAEIEIGSYTMQSHEDFMEIDLKDNIADAILVRVNSNHQGAYGTSSGIGEIIVNGQKVIDITPTMTSNTAPAPYVVKASSEYSSNHKAFHLFDNNKEKYWTNATGASFPTYCQIGNPTEQIKINMIEIINLQNKPAYIEIQGSDNDSDWHVIKRVENPMANTSVHTLPSKVVPFGKNVSYNYYRFVFAQGDGSYVHLAGIRLLYSETALDEIEEDDNDDSSDIELINVTPAMTSNTTPSPYTVSCSSEFNAQYSGWKAFNGTTENNADCWLTASGNNGWIKFDFGKKTGVKQVNITSRNDSVNVYPIKKITLFGSNDDSVFHEIKSQTFNTWNTNETKPIVLDEQCTYKIYKLEVENDSSYIAIGKIEFLQIEQLEQEEENEEETPNVSHKKASLAYTLPMATTKKILAKKNDARVGLLGMANDGQNFGDLYVVGTDGRSHLTKSGIKDKVLFEGSANAVGNYVLAESIDSFKVLLAEISLTRTGTYTNAYRTTYPIYVNSIQKNVTHDIMLYDMYESGNRYITLHFNAENNGFKIDVIQKGSLTNMQINKIVGIY